MDTLSVLLLSVALAMDAFATSICKGLSMEKFSWKNMIIVGAWFGGFQFLMPVIGYLAGSTFTSLVSKVAPYIAFVLLTLIGGSMIKEAFSKEENDMSSALSFKIMLLLAIATSIDALAIGVVFVCVPVEIVKSLGNFFNAFLASVIIGVVTFVISGIGVRFGSFFGIKYKKKATIAGGVVLILLGVKILLQHYGIINLNI